MVDPVVSPVFPNIAELAAVAGLEALGLHHLVTAGAGHAVGGVEVAVGVAAVAGARVPVIAGLVGIEHPIAAPLFSKTCTHR